MNNEYIYRGEYVDNYLKLGDRMFRIIKITDDGYLKLISESAEESEYLWDNRYNIDTNSSDGINDYEKSRLRENILKIYEKSKSFNLIKSKMVTKPICVGKRDKNNNSYSSLEECDLKLEGDYLSLIGSIDIALASIDQNCNNINDRSCSNYNYFRKFFKGSWLTIGTKGTTSKAYYISGTSLSERICTEERHIHLVIYVNGNEKLKSGDGSKNKPYII